MSWVWKHFKEFGKDKAKCIYVVISKFERIQELAQWLVINRHGVVKPSSQVGDEPTAKKQMTSLNQIPSFTIREIRCEILANCAAKNWISINSIKNCDAIKRYLRFKGFEMPKHNETIWNDIATFYNTK